ncbi:hypothetical protein [Mycolicibacterium goodii]
MRTAHRRVATAIAAGAAVISIGFAPAASAQTEPTALGPVATDVVQAGYHGFHGGGFHGFHGYGFRHGGWGPGFGWGYVRPWWRWW